MTYLECAHNIITVLVIPFVYYLTLTWQCVVRGGNIRPRGKIIKLIAQT